MSLIGKVANKVNLNEIYETANYERELLSVLL